MSRARLVKRNQVAASQSKQQTEKPVAPTTRIKQRKDNYQASKPTQASAREKFADLFTVKLERQ